MDAALPAHEADPGKGWRRLGRAVALLGIVLIFVPDSWGQSLVQEAGGFLRVALDLEPVWESDPCARILYTFFACYVPAMLLGGLLLALAFSRRVHSPRADRWIPHGAASLLWLLVLLPPYVFAAKHFSKLEGENARALLYGTLSAYLLVGGLSFLAARRKRRTAQFVFWLLAVPMPMLLLATLAVVLLNLRFSSVWEKCLALTGAGCSGTLALAWIQWWRAVAKHERSDKAPAPQPTKGA
ncbi:MAG: hypothetical protein L6R28_12475 [Planctomycetes bacterium]|nr:hypothetical protein [Planctomycetota bacterium]